VSFAYRDILHEQELNANAIGKHLVGARCCCPGPAGMNPAMREPLNVSVFLFRRGEQEGEFAIFRRSDDDNWQNVSGGVEKGETLVQAALRETAEEAGITHSFPLFKLDMVSGVAKTWFAAQRYWPDDLYIVRKHFFGMDLGDSDSDVVLSPEHVEFRWVPYEVATSLLRYDDDKTALWELDARIRRGDLPLT
jgi:dATP pyrophosphohydrolase